MPSLQDQFNRLRQSAQRKGTPTWPARKQRLRAIEKMLQTHEKELSDAISQDFGYRSPEETLYLEIIPSLRSVRHAIRRGARWMRPRRVHTSGLFWMGHSYVLPQPLGVVGIVVPWNYPLLLTIAPLVAAISAGNYAMVKVSEQSPALGALLQELIPQYFPAGEVSVVLGGPDRAAAFCHLPFDHLLFTGSTAVGREVMKAAASNLCPVTLELGGKSPALILSRVNLKSAVAAIMRGKLLNAGQTCIAPDYLLIPSALSTDFIHLAKKWVDEHYPRLYDNLDYTTIATDQQYRRLSTLLSELRMRGVRILALTDGKDDPDCRYLRPRVILDAPADTRLMQEEIFGPFLPIVTYEQESEAINYIQARPHPLALYIFGEDKRAINEVLSKTKAGGVAINDTLLHFAQEALPFGGIGASGMGVYHGRWGFDTFSHLKPIFHQSRFNLLPLLLPPYGRKFRWATSLIRRL